MGASRHCGHCLLGSGPRGDPQGTDWRSGGNVRRARAGEGRLTGARRRALRSISLAGLGLLVGAVSHRSAHAQQRRDTTRARRDTISVPARPPATREDSITAGLLPADSATAARAARDSAAARARADTIKAPLARGETPATPEITGKYHWDRQTIFSSGALTLLDLLDQIPGVTGYRSGWLATPHTPAYVGDFGRVRLYFDGLELDPLDPRDGGVQDLAAIQLWPLEDVTIEHAPNELRVHLRSWRVARTTPYTRVDVATGDLETNSYRGYFGKRFGGGGALQVGAQQYTTNDPRLGGDGDLTAAFGRVGWARRRWSIDAVLNRTRRNRAEQRRVGERPPLSPLEAVRSDAYLRLGYGDPERGLWAQALAGSMRFDERTERATSSVVTAAVSSALRADTADTSSSRSQYVLAGGADWRGLRLSAATRLRVFEGERFLATSGRIAYERPTVSIAAFAERRPTSLRGDVTVRASPLPYLALVGSIGTLRPLSSSVRLAETSFRGEAGVRVGRAWLTGGLMRRDTADLRPPVVYDTGFVSVASGPLTGTFASIRGPVWKAVGANVTAVRWSDRVAFVPEYHVRSEVYIRTNWLRRFPRGNFGFVLSAMHEYRSQATFPVSTGDSLLSSQFRSISTLLEIRLYDAVLSWQFRNVLGSVYQIVPGFEMPRGVNYYGVRWEFYN